MSTRIYVEPTGTPVPYPESRKALTAPGYVLDCTYWRRRLADGSVRLAALPVTDEAPPSAPKKKKGA